MFDLTGKVGVVTGGNGGIGLGSPRVWRNTVPVFASGAPTRTRTLRPRKSSSGTAGRVAALRCDVGVEEQVVDAFAETLAVFGHVDACFANAGVGGGGARFDAMTLEEWHRVFRVNMNGVMFTFREAVKHMRESGRGGSLVVTSSGTARFGAAGSEHYSATKAGVIALIQSLAVGQARYGIRANAIIPGWIETAMTARALQTEAFQTKVIKRIPSAAGASRRTSVPSRSTSQATKAATTPATPSPSTGGVSHF